MLQKWFLLQKMKNWELAPANPRMLAEEGIDFALQAKNLKKETALYQQ